MAQPVYPPLAQAFYPPTTSDPMAPLVYQANQPTAPPAGYPLVSHAQVPQTAGYPTPPPAGYPPVSQPNYTQAPAPAGYPPVSQPNYTQAPAPACYPPVSQSNCTQAPAPAPVGYPPVSQPNHTSQPNYTQAPAPAGYPPVSQPNCTQAPAPAGYPPVSQPNHAQAPAGYPPVSQPNYAQAPAPAGYPPVSQPNYAQAPAPAGYPQASQPNYTPTAAAVPAPTPQPSYNAITSPLPVIGPQYCLPHPVDLAVTRKLMTLTDDFVVTDVNNNVMFKLEGKLFSLRDKRVLLDSTGKPVVAMRKKILTAHSRWLACKGGSTDSRDLLFTAKTSTVIQLRTKLNVYLANRTSEDFADFMVHGSWSERSCVIYLGESNTIAAQMRMKESAESYFLGKDTFMITVYPNVDYAFIVALIVILDAINTEYDI